MGRKKRKTKALDRRFARPSGTSPFFRTSNSWIARSLAINALPSPPYLQDLPSPPAGRAAEWRRPRRSGSGACTSVSSSNLGVRRAPESHAQAPLSSRDACRTCDAECAAAETVGRFFKRLAFTSAACPRAVAGSLVRRRGVPLPWRTPQRSPDVWREVSTPVSSPHEARVARERS